MHTERTEVFCFTQSLKRTQSFFLFHTERTEDTEKLYKILIYSILI
jgi:hypothetical protein